MISCNRTAKLVSRYLDNDLDLEKQRSVERHLASCEKCKKIFDSYMSLKRLVIESHVVAVPVAQTIGSPAASRTPHFYFPVWNTGFKLAAMLMLFCSLAVAFLIHSSLKQPALLPVVIGRESGPVMNTPLCALVYYEEIAGKAIHSQYGNLPEPSRALYERTTVDYRTISSYESPLFYDDHSIQRRYGSIIINRVF
jgi:hypothetical protein